MAQPPPPRMTAHKGGLKVPSAGAVSAGHQVWNQTQPGLNSPALLLTSYVSPSKLVNVPSLSLPISKMGSYYPPQSCWTGICMVSILHTHGACCLPMP